jgi:hypothetical protein
MAVGDDDRFISHQPASLHPLVVCILKRDLDPTYRAGLPRTKMFRAGEADEIASLARLTLPASPEHEHRLDHAERAGTVGRGAKHDGLQRAIFLGGGMVFSSHPTFSKQSDEGLRPPSEREPSGPSLLRLESSSEASFGITASVSHGLRAHAAHGLGHRKSDMELLLL